VQDIIFPDVFRPGHPGFGAVAAELTVRSKITDIFMILIIEITIP
jgi:hypothetical protein